MTLNKILQLTVGMERCVWSQIRIQSAYSTTNVLNGPKAPGGKGGKAGQSVGKCRRALSVETNPEKLVNFVCGTDYRNEEHREGDVPIKPDSEYPDWLFTMDVSRPKPNARDMKDKNTIEYYEKLRQEHMAMQRRLMRKKLFRFKLDRK